VGLDDGLLDDGGCGVGQDNVARLDLGCCEIADQLVGGSDSVADKDVDFF
jgi:hypothetical protein